MCYCNKTDDNYYTYTNGTPLTDCKDCHNSKRYTKKPTGFAKLNLQTQNQILELVKQKTNWKFIAEVANVHYHTLLRWRSKGFI